MDKTIAVNIWFMKCFLQVEKFHVRWKIFFSLNLLTIIAKIQWNKNQPLLKVALSQKILENFSFSKINIPNHYPEQIIWKLFTVLGRKFKFSAQDSDLEYLYWRSNNPTVSSDLKPPLHSYADFFWKLLHMQSECKMYDHSIHL